MSPARLSGRRSTEAARVAFHAHHFRRGFDTFASLLGDVDGVVVDAFGLGLDQVAHEKWFGVSTHGKWFGVSINNIAG